MYTVNPLFEAPTLRRQRLSGFSGLGASDTPVQMDSNDILNMGTQLRAAQSRLTALFQQMQQSPDLARAIGADVTAQQAALGDLIAKYVGVYYSIFGQNPAGLGNPILIAAAVAVILSYVAANLYLWYQKQDVLEKQAQAQVLAEQNRGAIITASQQKQQQAWDLANAGDAAGAATAQAEADAILTQAGIPGAGAPPPPSSPQGLGDWMKVNWPIVAGVAAAIVFLPKIAGR